MKIVVSLALAVLILLGCSVAGSPAPVPSIVLDASTLDDWNRLGNANWRAVDGVVQADRGDGYLVSKSVYRDFELRAEFWVDEEANSGIFLRMQNPGEVTPMNSYEVNIFDRRPDPSFGTGAIVGFARVSPMPKAAGRWNTYRITARGSRIEVELNGVRTATLDDDKFPSGPVAVQYAGGVVKFRKLEVRPL